jgi:hypothetical protein
MRNDVPNTRNAIGVGALLAFLLISMGCSTKSRHRVIIYDHSWSSDAAVKNLWCAPQLSKACAQQSREAELSLSNRLPRAFGAAPECANVSFLILSADDKNSSELERKLKNPGSVYWRLRVDFHPGLKMQPFTLGPGEKSSLVGGDDAEHDAAFICTSAKNNGVTAVW